MLLVTTTRIVNGYRIIAATTCCAPAYQWSLYRNGVLVCPSTWSEWLDNGAYFELRRPLVPGIYQLGVASFGGGDRRQPRDSTVVTALVIRCDSPGQHAPLSR